MATSLNAVNYVWPNKNVQLFFPAVSFDACGLLMSWPIHSKWSCWFWANWSGTWLQSCHMISLSISCPSWGSFHPPSTSWENMLRHLLLFVPQVRGKSAFHTRQCHGCVDLHQWTTELQKKTILTDIILKLQLILNFKQLIFRCYFFPPLWF